MLSTTFNTLPVTSRAFVSWAPIVKEAKTDLGLLIFNRFDPCTSKINQDLYEAERQRWLKEGKPLNEQLLYHGCPSEVGRASILSTGFKLDYLGTHSGNRGLYGAGIYFSNIPNGAIGYSSPERQHDALPSYSVLLCKVLVGKSLQLPMQYRYSMEEQKQTEAAGGDYLTLAYPFTGMSQVEGYDTHCAVDEVVVFNPTQILPLGILHMDVAPCHR